MVRTLHYFANAVGSVDYVPDACVYLHWSGIPLSRLELRALHVHAHNLLAYHQLTAILADHHAMPDAPGEADREWLMHKWLPETVAETSFRRYAVSPTPDPNRRLHTDMVVRDFRHHVRGGVFQDLD